MPKMVLTAAVGIIGTNDISNYANKIELKVDVEEKDVTTYGSDGWKEVLGGLKGGELSLEFKQDVAAGALDEIMWAKMGTVDTFAVRLTDAATSTSNPAYTGSCLIKGWSPLQGSVGDDAQVSQSYPTSGVVTRTTG